MFQKPYLDILRLVHIQLFEICPTPAPVQLASGMVHLFLSNQSLSGFIQSTLTVSQHFRGLIYTSGVKSWTQPELSAVAHLVQP